MPVSIKSPFDVNQKNGCQFPRSVSNEEGALSHHMNISLKIFIHKKSVPHEHMKEISRRLKMLGRAQHTKDFISDTRSFTIILHSKYKIKSSICFFLRSLNYHLQISSSLHVGTKK